MMSLLCTGGRWVRELPGWGNLARVGEWWWGHHFVNHGTGTAMMMADGDSLALICQAAAHATDCPHHLLWAVQAMRVCVMVGAAVALGGGWLATP